MVLFTPWEILFCPVGYLTAPTLGRLVGRVLSFNLSITVEILSVFQDSLTSGMILTHLHFSVHFTQVS